MILGERKTLFRSIDSTSHRMPSLTPSPVSAETGITMKSRRPIWMPDCWNTGLISRTPIQSGKSCLLAKTRSGTPAKCSLVIILSAKLNGMWYRTGHFQFTTSFLYQKHFSIHPFALDRVNRWHKLMHDILDNIYPTVIAILFDRLNPRNSIELLECLFGQCSSQLLLWCVLDSLLCSF